MNQATETTPTGHHRTASFTLKLNLENPDKNQAHEDRRVENISHQISRQSQTTQLQPQLHRLARSPALRPQRRLPRRIVRWYPPHRPAPDIRRHLCQHGCSAGIHTRFNREPFLAGEPQATATFTRTPRHHHGRHRALTEALIGLPCPSGACPTRELQVIVRYFAGEHKKLWKILSHPRISPVIAGDTTYCVSLLTGTTDGSNFAFPRTKFRLTGMGRNLVESKQSNGTRAKPEVTRPIV